MSESTLASGFSIRARGTGAGRAFGTTCLSRQRLGRPHNVIEMIKLETVDMMIVIARTAEPLISTMSGDTLLKHA